MGTDREDAVEDLRTALGTVSDTGQRCRHLPDVDRMLLDADGWDEDAVDLLMVDDVMGCLASLERATRLRVEACTLHLLVLGEPLEQPFTINQERAAAGFPPIVVQVDPVMPCCCNTTVFGGWHLNGTARMHSEARVLGRCRGCPTHGDQVVAVDPTLPTDTVELRDNEGRVLGRIVGLEVES